jgi:transposase
MSMRKIKELLRLRYECGLSLERIAKALPISLGTVHEYIVRAKGAGLSWPLPEDLDDEALESMLFPRSRLPSPKRAEPNWAQFHQELKRKGVTLSLLWIEYKTEHPDGYQYTQFCHHYRDFAKAIDVTMRQVHKAGEKLFVDYAGQTLPVTDPQTGEVRQAQIFVATLGASNYTYAEAAWSQDLPSWISAHVRAFEFFGGIPAIVVPDNLRSGVSRACRYEPDLNPTYHELALHYGTAIIPARVRKPRDKAKVENGVLVVERWILAALRNHRFFSLADLNETIRTLLERLNYRPFKKLPGSRHSMFEQVDRPALKPLPSLRYELAEWKKVRVNIDYHVTIEHHHYSVPYSLARQELEARITSTTIEILHRGRRIASHIRSDKPHIYTTLSDHMPKAHQHHLEWSPTKLIAWAGRTGPQTEALVTAILQGRQHPEQGYRSCLGLMRLEKHVGKERLEAACKRALTIGAVSYKSVDSILKNGLDQCQLDLPLDSPPILHENIRGASYYTRKETHAESPDSREIRSPQTQNHGTGSQRTDGGPSLP